MPRKRTQVEDVDRSMYDFVMPEDNVERYADGLTPELVRMISAKHNEPSWMLDLRLETLERYHDMRMASNWGPDTSSLDMDHISNYVGQIGHRKGFGVGGERGG